MKSAPSSLFAPSPSSFHLIPRSDDNSTEQIQHTVRDEAGHMVSTAVIAIVVVLGIFLLLGAAVGLTALLRRRKDRSMQADSQMETQELHGSRPRQSSWQQPLLASSPPKPHFMPVKDHDDDEPLHLKGGSSRTSSDSDDTITYHSQEWHGAVPGSEDLHYLPKIPAPQHTPSPSISSQRTVLPRIDTSPKQAPKQAPQSGPAVLEALQSGVTPTYATSIYTASGETASLYSLPSAEAHDYQNYSYSIPPPPVPAIPAQYASQKTSFIAPPPPPPLTFAEDIRPKLPLPDEVSPLTRGNTRAVAGLLKTRANRGSPDDLDRVKRSETKVSQIERDGSIRSIR